MRVWSIVALALVVVVAVVSAQPIEQQEEIEQSTGSKTWHAVKSFFSPVTTYFTEKLPEKTPTDVAQDVKDRVTDVREWASESDAIQALIGAVRPVNNWVQEKATALKDKTFQDMYEDIKSRVSDLDHKIGEWIQQRTQQDQELLK